MSWEAFCGASEVVGNGEPVATGRASIRRVTSTQPLPGPRPGVDARRDSSAWVAAQGAAGVPRPPDRRRGLERRSAATDAARSGRCRRPLRDGARRARSASTPSPTPSSALADGGLTEKALHRLDDGALIESVLMHYPARGRTRERHTLCISSQAGCAVGCPFCATGELGFGRDLETAEIVDQVRHAARRLAATGQRLTNVVFMGMGEPLLNLDRVLAAVEALNDPARFGLGRAAHHGVHVGRRAGHPAADRARAAVHAGGLAPRRARRAARRARAAQPPLAGRRGRRRRARPRRAPPAAGSATSSR